MSSDLTLKKRAITAACFVALLITIVRYGGEIGLTALVVTLGVLAALEFYRLVGRNTVKPLSYLGMVLIALFIISRNHYAIAYAQPWFTQQQITALLLMSSVLPPLIWLMLRRRKAEAFASWVWTIAGVLYIGWMLSHMVALRGLEDGRNWVFFVLFVTWMSDTIAYFTGRRWGRNKLAPHISPSKTWEGFFGGLGAAAAISVLFFTPTPVRLPIAYWQAVPLAIGVSALGQAGDLIESLFKRHMNSKDSGHLMPGHGGMLDRIDSLIFSSVLVYYYVLLT